APPPAGAKPTPPPAVPSSLENPFTPTVAKPAPAPPPGGKATGGPKTITLGGNSHRPPLEEIIPDKIEKSKDPLAAWQSARVPEGVAKSADAARPPAETVPGEQPSVVPGPLSNRSSRANARRGSSASSAAPNDSSVSAQRESTEEGPTSS